MKLWWDLETYSETPITDGAHRYAESAEVLLFAWAVDDGPVQCWDASDHRHGSSPTLPAPLLDDIARCDEFWGHGSGMFDRPVIRKALPGFSGWTHSKGHRDTMAQAYAHGLPGSLGTLCEIFKLDADVAKDKRGRQLILKFCKPRPKNEKVRRHTRETHPTEWAEFIEYAKSDITSMRILHQKMPKWNYPGNEQELALWQLDQRINNEGVYVDQTLAAKAIEATDFAQAQLASDVSEATDDAVTSATQRDKLIAYILSEHEVSLPDMRADTLERRLSDPSLPDGVRDLIAIRLAASTSSVSKFKRVIRSTSSDGYLRGGIQFCGAGRTGRDAHRLVQMGNMMRPTLDAETIEQGIEAIKAGCADLITDNVMELCANTMRGVIIAPPKKKIVVSDLANIEGRVAAWLAGEHWKLKAFRDYDAGTGPDLYVKAYSEAFRVPYGVVTKAARQIGKVMELMLQYAGGVGAFLTGAATYGIDLDDLAETGWDVIPATVRDEAENFWNWSKEAKRSTYGLEQRTFMVCDSIKRLWRATNPAIAGIWKQLEDAARAAISEPHTDFPVGRVTFRREGNWLRVKLPSGRDLSYVAPRVDESGAISYMGMNQYSRKWQRLTTYGGKIFENICQAIARDVMFYRMPEITAAGYSIRMRVHDELITYAPDGALYGPQHLSELLSAGSHWTAGLPLAAAGFEGQRYRKD
jgi:DNA polymerase